MCSGLRSASISRAQLASRSELAELERLLDEELSKALVVEGQLQATQVWGQEKFRGRYEPEVWVP